MADMIASTTLEAVDIMGLMKLLPHRYPFLMIDRISTSMATNPLLASRT